MKKLLSLILSLMLVFSACALAETTAVDFGTFSMQLGPNDQYEVAAAMNDGELYAIIYPDYDPNSAITNTINIVWTATDLMAEINSVGGMDTYAELVLQIVEPQYAALGITMTNGYVISTNLDEQRAASLCSYTLDYTGAGVDLVTELYQTQVLFFNGEGDNYIFTLTTHTMDEMMALMLCLDTVTFKNAQMQTVDFGAFTMEIGANEYYEVADTMTSNNVYLIIYPDYNLTGQTTNNINVVYTEDNLTQQLALVGGIEKYAELVLKQTAPQYEAMGIKMTDAQILYALHEDDNAAIIMASTLDYSGAGVDLVLTLYQMVGMFLNTPSGDYIFTVTSDSMTTLSEMASRLDTVQFK